LVSNKIKTNSDSEIAEEECYDEFRIFTFILFISFNIKREQFQTLTGNNRVYQEREQID